MALKLLDKKDCTVGMRVMDSNGLEGTARWIGRIEKAAKPPKNDAGTYMAVEMDWATEALTRTDGVWPKEDGTRYCEAPAGTVVFKKCKEMFPAKNEEGIKALREHFGEKITNYTDVQLVKFLIARKYELPKVIEMMEKNFKWVEDFKPTHDEYFPPTMGEHWPVGYSDGLDRDGNLIYIERPGNGGAIHPKEFVKQYGVGRICRWHVAGMEVGKKLMADSGFKSRRVTAIVDLTKMGDSDAGVRKFAKSIAAIDQDNFPEHLSRMFIVNAPTLFTALWAVIKLFVDDRTKNKIFILGPKESKKVIGEHIDEKWLPEFLGGTDTTWLKNGGIIGSTDPSKLVDVEDAGTWLPEEPVTPATPQAEVAKEEEKKE